jgi:hypothetical protein
VFLQLPIKKIKKSDRHEIDLNSIPSSKNKSSSPCTNRARGGVLQQKARLFLSACAALSSSLHVRRLERSSAIFSTFDAQTLLDEGD